MGFFNLIKGGGRVVSDPLGDTDGERVVLILVSSVNPIKFPLYYGVNYRVFRSINLDVKTFQGTYRPPPPLF